MARWKLATPHYLNVGDENQWEYQETERGTGKRKRRMFTVPRHLDPDNPGDWTNRWGRQNDEDGEIIVCQPGKGADTDITFYGDPTPDMVPVDDEAKAISASFEHHWSYKPDTGSMPGEFSASLINKFQADLADVQAKPAQIEGMTDLIAIMAQSAKQNADILAALAPTRRV